MEKPEAAEGAKNSERGRDRGGAAGRKEKQGKKLAFVAPEPKPQSGAAGRSDQRNHRGYAGRQEQPPANAGILRLQQLAGNAVVKRLLAPSAVQSPTHRAVGVASLDLSGGREIMMDGSVAADALTDAKTRKVAGDGSGVAGSTGGGLSGTGAGGRGRSQGGSGRQAGVMASEHSGLLLRSPVLVLSMQRTIGNFGTCEFLQRANGEVRPGGQTGQRVQRSPAPASDAAGNGGYPGPPTADGAPEQGKQLSAELSDSPPGADPSERVFKWLQAHAQEIATQERRFGVDRRAIAGAIAWEALHNPRSFPFHIFGRFAGAGKPHVKTNWLIPAFLHTGENIPEEVEQAGLLPRRSLLEREMALYRNSIPDIAAGMRLATEIARKYGRDISNNPGMLTWFWVSKDANKFIEYWSQKQGDTFDLSAEKMPKWVLENLGWLAKAVGDPQLNHTIDQAGPRYGTMETGSWKGVYSIDARLPETRQFLVNGGKVILKISAYSDVVAANGFGVHVLLHCRQGGSDVELDGRRFAIGEEETFTWSGLTDGLYFFEIYSNNGVHIDGELDVVLPACP